MLQIIYANLLLYYFRLGIDFEPLALGTMIDNNLIGKVSIGDS